MGTIGKEARAAYWKRYRESRLPYVSRPCTECGEIFNPRGPQERCQSCRTATCPTCNGQFVTTTRRTTYCSRRCVGLTQGNVDRLVTLSTGRPSGGTSVRFWRHVQKSDGCWTWTASHYTTGYGSFYDGERLTGAHRASWEMTNGEVPDGLCVLHRCDNRLCVRPDHLFLGTKADNTMDMLVKNRQSCKLTVEAVRVIRASSEAGPVLAARYGVSRSLIVKVRSRQVWRHVA